jgi:hypothetical protein
MVQEEITIMNHGILHKLHPAFIASSGIALAARIGKVLLCDILNRISTLIATNYRCHEH